MKPLATAEDLAGKTDELARRTKPAPPTRVAILGCGYWGLNHLRIFSELPDAEVSAVCDLNAERLTEVGRRFPGLKLATNASELMDDDAVEAVVICSAANTHYQLAKDALEAGKHVLVEKPLTTNSAEADELVRLSKEHKRLLVVGHTFLYNSAVRKVKEYIASATVDDVYYLYARRTNLGPIRTDVNAVWDLAAHDVSIFNYLLDDRPTWVSAVGARVLRNHREDVGFISLGYECGVVGHIHVSWAEPNKVREVVVVGSDRRIVFNDLDPLERVRVFFRGVAPMASEVPSSFGEHHLQLREGDILSPALSVTEPLKHECGHFLHCVRRGETPFTTALQGSEVVRVLEAIDESMIRSGVPVSVSDKSVYEALHDTVRTVR